MWVSHHPDADSVHDSEICPRVTAAGCGKWFLRIHRLAMMPVEVGEDELLEIRKAVSE